ncbi:hypothetical protein [Methylobacterium brachiatum]
MAQAEDVPMSRQEFSVAYDGPSRADDHSIDVRNLAPALLAFGRLLREANTEFNGKKSTTKVLVVSDFEHKCFNINFELIVGFYDQIKQLLGLDQVKTAKEILEWIGLLKGPLYGVGLATGYISFLKYLEWKKGQDIIEERVESDPRGIIKVTIKGNGNSVCLTPEIYSLSKNPKALRATQDAFLPLGHDGFETMRVSGDEEDTPEDFTPEEVANIAASCVKGIEESKEVNGPDVEETPAWLSVYSPVYDASATNWRFRLGLETIHADITETTIAQDALKRGGALSDDTYQVVLEITTHYDSDNNPKQPTYKIKKVMRFVPARTTRQTDLFNPDGA